MRVLALGLMLLSTPLFAAEPVRPADASTPPRTACEELNAQGADGEALAQRGCCSWHDGVCGCSGGRLVCCDGSYSPTCLCDHDEAPKAEL